MSSNGLGKHRITVSTGQNIIGITISTEKKKRAFGEHKLNLTELMN